MAMTNEDSLEDYKDLRRAADSVLTATRGDRSGHQGAEVTRPQILSESSSVSLGSRGQIPEDERYDDIRSAGAMSFDDFADLMGLVKEQSGFDRNSASMLLARYRQLVGMRHKYDMGEDGEGKDGKDTYYLDRDDETEYNALVQDIEKLGETLEEVGEEVPDKKKTKIKISLPNEKGIRETGTELSLKSPDDKIGENRKIDWVINCWKDGITAVLFVFTTTPDSNEKLTRVGFNSKTYGRFTIPFDTLKDALSLKNSLNGSSEKKTIDFTPDKAAETIRSVLINGVSHHDLKVIIQRPL